MTTSKTNTSGSHSSAFPHRSGLIPRSTASLLALSLIYLSPSFAQESEEEDIFELSPFEVKPEQGWYATETLAGSRMRTSFEDVASQVEVITMDFMDDYGLNSIEEAAVYSLNMENQEEYASSGAGKQSNDGAVRIRGLATSSRTREFFGTYLASDNYNLSRVTMSSGPNSILFGTGSPGGVVDSSLKRATFDTFGKVGAQMDSWEGYRVEFDYNTEIIDDKLAFRISAVDSKKSFDVEPAWEKSERFYATALYRPFEKTSFSLHYETADIESRRPARNAPYDEASLWYMAGDLGSTAYGNQHLFQNTATWRDGVDLNNDGDFNDAGELSPRAIADPNVFGTSGEAIVLLTGYNPGGVAPNSWYGSVGVERLDGYPGLIDPVNRDVDGTTLPNDNRYDRSRNTMFNIDWEEDSAEIFNVFFNHEIVENLHFEAAFQKETYDDFYGNLMGFRSSVTLQVDPNAYLPNGVTPNPYAGQLYFQGSPESNEGERERDEWRTALSYEFDFKDTFNDSIFKHFGKHRLALLASESNQETMSQEYRYYIQPKVENGVMRDPYFDNYPYADYPDDTLGRLALSELGANFTGIDGNRFLSVRTYLDRYGDFIPQTDFYPGQPFTIVDSNSEEWTIDPYHAAVGTNGEQLITGRNVGGIKTKFETKQWAYQGFLADNRVVLTYGWREDTLNSADEQAPEVFWQNPETGQVVSAGSAGFQAHRSLYGYQDFGAASSGETEYKGVVLHPFRGWDWKLPLGADLSLLYSDSNTFQPNRTSLEPDGSFQEGEKGSGDDIGFRLSLFEDKFSVRYNQYETTAGPSNLNLPFRRFRFALRPVSRDLLQGLVYDLNSFESFTSRFPDWPFLATSADPTKIYPFESGGGFDAMNFFNYGDPYAMSADTVATGDEITLRWKPKKNLDIRATWNDQQVVQSNIATNWIQFAQELYEIMENTKFVEGYVPGDSQSHFHNPAGFDMDGLDLDPNDGLAPGIDYFGWDMIPDGGGNGSSNPTNVGNPNLPWGQNNDSIYSGMGLMGQTAWTRNTMKEQFERDVFLGNAGIPVMQAYEGRPNEFVRQNRWNVNAMYRFTEGKFKGLNVGAAYRWRDAPAVGFGVQDVNGALVPDTSIILKGAKEDAVDFTFGYSGKLEFLDDRHYTLRFQVRNAFPGDRYVPKHIDFYTGQAISEVRVPGRQFVLSLDLDL
ncbi:hypothetical protein IEN85_08405 [Pelagicoccus sp. NFK12]|uniref:TonB-dependent receptor plug domain-containing protein n=1 Tax=Pelagicoccus enzymogenes TaxID=2773457 RepID=A0A927F6V0_9BACT|nr:hypothetical protein [Pelagicoccus enzymogenes]MBD5779513.1 hypothetical protein [Pelagicoccus enzymogenes]